MTPTRKPPLVTDAELAKILAPLANPDTCSEEAWQGVVQKLLTIYGWKWNFNRKAMVRGRWVTNSTSPGYPDITAFNPPWVLFLELKSVKGRRDERPGQRKWIAGLQRCGGNVLAFFATPREAAAVVAMIADPAQFLMDRHPTRPTEPVLGSVPTLKETAP